MRRYSSREFSFQGEQHGRGTKPRRARDRFSVQPVSSPLVKGSFGGDFFGDFLEGFLELTFDGLTVNIGTWADIAIGDSLRWGKGEVCRSACGLPRGVQNVKPSLGH